MNQPDPLLQWRRNFFLLLIGIPVGCVAYIGVLLTVGLITGIIAVLQIAAAPLLVQGSLCALLLAFALWHNSRVLAYSAVFVSGLFPPLALLGAYMHAQSRCGTWDWSAFDHHVHSATYPKPQVSVGKEFLANICISQHYGDHTLWIVLLVYTVVALLASLVVLLLVKREIDRIRRILATID